MYMYVFIKRSFLLVFQIFERPMVIDSLNLNLSQISCQIADFKGFMDFGRFLDLTTDLRISVRKTTLPARVISRSNIILLS